MNYFQSIQHPGFDLTGVAMTTVLGVAQMYPFCKHGSEIPGIIASVGEAIYASNWYQQPSDQQKYIQMIIAFAHVPRKVTGNGIVDCNYETYMKASKLISKIE